MCWLRRPWETKSGGTRAGKTWGWGWITGQGSPGQAVQRGNSGGNFAAFKIQFCSFKIHTHTYIHLNTYTYSSFHSHSNFCSAYFLLFSHRKVPYFLLFNEFYFIYSCTVIIRTQFCSISIPTPNPSPPPPPVSFGNHEFFKVCQSVYVMQRSSLRPFFRFHMLVKAFDVAVSPSG